MNIKSKIMVLLLLFVLLFSISNAFAAENADDNNNTILTESSSYGVEDNSPVLSDSQISDNSNDNEVIASSMSEEDNLSAGELSFSVLKSKIDAAGDYFELDGNYKYQNGDLAYYNGIEINKKITIDGLGKYYIDGASTARIFKVTAGDVVFQNLTFQNAYRKENNTDSYQRHGAAIWYNTAGINTFLINCNFINNRVYATQSFDGVGGSIWWQGTTGFNAVNCTFKGSKNNDKMARRGGALYLDGSDINITRCTFINISNYQDCNGEAVYHNGNTHKNLTIEHCTFLDKWDNSASCCLYFQTHHELLIYNNTFNHWLSRDALLRFGGAVMEDIKVINNTIENIVYTGNWRTSIRFDNINCGLVLIANNTFKNLASGQQNMYLQSSTDTGILIIANNTFDDLWTHSYQGAAFYIHQGFEKVIVCNNSFNNLSGQTWGAIASNSPLYIENNTFNECKLHGNGDRIVAKGTAVYSANYTYIKNNTFTGCYYSNTPNVANGIIFVSDTGWAYIDNNTFINNNITSSIAMHTAVVHIDANNSIISNNSFSDCICTGALGGSIYNTGSNVQILNNNFTNSLASTGGVIYSTGDGVNITYNNITNCHADGDAGALYITGYNCNISNNYFNNIYATNYGVIYCDNAEESILYNNTYIDNHAANNGVLYIGSSIVVDSQNFTRNYVTDGQAGTIMISGDNNSINNVNITESNATANGGSIYNKGNGNNLTNIIIINTTSVSGYGGAIYSIGDALNITLLNVYNASAAIDGGAVYSAGANSEISYSSFDNVFALNNGGVIFWSGADGILSNISINNAYADGDGGAIYCTGINTIMNNLTFNDIHGGSGGAIYCVGSGSEIHRADFKNIQAIGDGGAIYWTGANAIFTNITFNTINATGSGGAIFGTGVDSTLEDLYFDDINATINGGALNWAGARTVLNNITLTNIKSGANGGALYFTGDKSSLKKAKFENISSEGNGGAVYWSGSTGNMTTVSFINCTAKDMGGAVYWIGTLSNVSDANFTNNSAENGGAILWNAADGRLYQANFSNNNATGNGGAIYWIGNNAVMYNLNMSNNNATFKGGAINIIGNTVSFTNFTLFDNHAGVDGGAIVMDGSDCTMKDSTFTNNSARTNAGALYWAGVDGVLTNVNFTNNTGGIGGAVYWSSNNANITDVDFINNSANTAGALYMGGLRNNTLTNGNFINNTANTTGGAIYWAASDGNLTNCIFDIAKANEGGAIYWAGSNGFLNDLTFTNVYAIENAGILYVSASNINISNSNFYNSHANDGGALYIVGSGVALKNANFDNNSVSENGGAIYWIGNGASINNVNLTNNTADVDGGALYIVSYDAVLINIQLFRNNASNYGGGIYWGGTGNMANATFEFNRAFSGSAIYNGGTLSMENAYVLNNKANITSFDIIKNETNILLTIITVLTGYDNFLNAIWTTSDNINVKNITYWGVAGETVSDNTWITPVNGVSESTLYFDSRLAGMPINVNIKQEGSYNDNYVGTTNIWGCYTHTDNIPPKGNYKVTASHPDDNYYFGFSDTVDMGFGIPVPIVYVSLNSSEVYYNSDVTVKVQSIRIDPAGNPIPTMGKADIYIDGKSIGLTLDVVDSSAQYIITLPKEFTVGLHNITAFFHDGKTNTGDDLGPAYSDPYYFNVVKNFMPTVVDISTVSPTFYVGENFNITVSGPESYLGSISYVARNLEGIFSLVNGTYNISACYSEEGPVYVLLYIGGDDNYLPSSASYTFNVVRKPISLKFENATRSILNSINVGDDAVIQINLSDDSATGNVIVNIDGVDYAAPINGSFATVIVSNLNNGVHTIVASYEGNNQYNPSSPVTATLAVNKININSINVTADNENFLVGDNVSFTINISSTNSSKYPVNGIVNVTVNGKNYEVYINDNMGYMTVQDLPSGNHSVSVFYAGDNQFNSRFDTVNNVVNVDKINTEIIITPDNPIIFVGDDVAFDITVNCDKYDINDTLIIKIDNAEYNVPVIDGKAYLNISGLKYKSDAYNVNVSYRGNSQFKASNATTSIQVNKVDITGVDIKLSKDTIYVGENIVLNINVTAEKYVVNGLVSVTVNGVEFNASIVDGKGSLTIPGFTNGTYDVIVSYDGDDTFNAYPSVSSSITVKKVAIDDIKVSTNSPIYVGEDAILNVNVTTNYHDFNGIITVKVNGREYNLTVVEGIGSLNVLGLNNGTYEVFISFGGNDKFNEFNKYSSLNVTSVIVNKIPTKIEMNDVTINVGNVAVIVARLNSTQATGNITFTVDNKEYPVGIVDGVAVLEVYGLNTSANTTITAKYSGDNKFTNSSTTAVLTVNKVSDYATISVYDINAGEMENVVIILPSDVSNGTITVKFNNTELGSGEYTITNNVIVFNKTIQIADTYNVSVSVVDDAKYNNITASNKFSVFKVGDYELKADIDNVILGEKPVVKVILPSDAVSGNVIIDGEIYTIVDAKAGVVLPAKNKTGTYNVNVKYVDDVKYKNKTITAQYTISKANSKVSIDMNNVFVVGEDIHFTVNTINSTGKISVIINDNVYQPRNATEYVIAGGLANATYNVIVKLAEDNNYNASETSKIIYVNKDNVSIILNPITNTYNVDDNVVITAKFNKNISGDVIFNINGNNYTVNVNNDDHASYTYVPRANGTYSVSASYEGSNRFNPNRTSSSVSFVANKISTKLLVTSNPIYVGQNAIINVEVISNEATGNVNITVNGKKYNVVLNNGHGSITVSGLSNTTDNNIVAFYNGDNKYDVSSNVSSISVSKVNIASIVLTPSNQFIYVGQNAVFDIITVPSINTYQVNGFVTVTVNNKEYNVSIVNNSGVLSVNGLSEGKYALNVSYIGDDMYYPSTVVDVANVTVNKVDINYIGVSLLKPAIYVGEDAVMDIVISPRVDEYAVNGFVTVTVDDKPYNVSIVNNTGRLTVPGLNAGIHFIDVSYGGDNVFKFKTIPNVASVNVNKVPVSVALDHIIQNIYVGDNATLSIDVNPTIENYTVNGYVSVYVDNVEYNVSIINNTGNLVVYGLANATYNVDVVYLGDNVFDSCYAMKISTIAVNKIPTKIELNNVDIKVGEIANIIASINNTEVTGNVIFIVDNKEYTTGIVNGKAYLNVSGLNTSANMTVTAVYSGDYKFINSTNTSSLHITKVDSNASIIVYDRTAGETENVIINLPNDITNATITVKFNDNEISDYVINNNVITFNRTIQESGEYSVSISVYDDCKYNDFNNHTTFKVSKVAAENYTLILDINDTHVFEDIPLIVTLPNDANESVIVSVDDNIFGVVDVNNGVASCTLDNLSYGNHTIAVDYVNDKYDEKIVSTVVFVDKIDSNISIVNPIDPRVAHDIIIKVIPEGSTGNITATINDKNYSVIDNTINASELLEGNYTIVVNLDGDENYFASQAHSVFTVKRNDVSLQLRNITDDIFVDSNVVLHVGFNESVSGDVIFNIDGMNYTVTIKDSNIAEYTWNPKKSTNVHVSVYYLGNDTYYPNSSNDIMVNVVKNPVCFNDVVVNDIMVDDVENIIVSFNVTDVMGVLTIKVNGTLYKCNVEGGLAFLDIPDLPAGNYEVSISYSGDDKYLEIPSTEFSFNVSKYSTPIIINVSDIMVYEDAIIKISLPEEINNLIWVSVGDEFIHIPLINGSALLNITDLPAENYGVNVNYDGNYKYLSNYSSTSFAVNRYEPTFNVNASDVCWTCENINIDVELPEDATGNVTLSLNDELYTLPVINGTVNFNIPELSPGNYSAVVLYSGDDKYSNASYGYDFVVNLNNPVIESDDVMKYYKGSERLKVNLTNVRGDKLSNQTLYIVINGVTYTRVTNDDGYMSIAINLPSGEYDALIIYNTSEEYDPVSKTVHVTVLSTIVANDLIKVQGNASQYWAYFTDSEGNALANTKVTFNINGVFYNRTTNGSGWAKLNINLPEGNYTITAYNLVTGEAHSNNITVLSRITENYDMVKYYGDGQKFTVCIIGDDGEIVGAGVNVTFNINGVFYTRTTDIKGTAALNINLPEGVYIITTYQGSCVESNTITVLNKGGAIL